MFILHTIASVYMFIWEFITQFLHFILYKMTTYEIYQKEQFRKCQATETRRQDENGNVIVVFYSYACPELVKIRGARYKFTYENSRKA